MSDAYLTGYSLDEIREFQTRILLHEMYLRYRRRFYSSRKRKVLRKLRKHKSMLLD
jgi:hypothetical protein